jgi:hypothetical protein
MVTRNEDQTIKLEMVIDRAELERQLGTVFQTAGTGTGGGVAARGSGGAAGTSAQKPMHVDAAGGMGKELKQLRNLAKMYFGISAMVKNSQVLNTTLGAIGATMGALADSFLAPLVPLLMPVLTELARFIPAMAKAGEDTAAALAAGGRAVNSIVPGGLGAGSPAMQGVSKYTDIMKFFPLLGGPATILGQRARGEEYDFTEAAKNAVPLFAIINSLNKRFGSDDEEVRARSGPNITIQGNSTDEIMSQVRAELEAHRRDTSSGSAGAN